MSYSPTSFAEITLLIFWLLAFSILSWKRREWAVLVVLFLLPSYLVRLGFWFPPLGPGGIPTTLLEVLIYIVFLAWVKDAFGKLSVSEISQKFLDRLRRFWGTGWRQSLGASFWFPIAFILLGASISVLATPYTLKSLGVLKGFFIDPLLFLIAAQDVLSRNGSFRPFLSSVALSGFSVALIALFYLASNVLTYDGRLRAFFESPNHLAMFIAPLFLFTTYFVLTSRGLRRLFWVFIGGMLGTVLYFTFSFGAWFGVLGALAFLSFWLFVFEYSKKIRMGASRPWYMRVRGVFVSILILLVILDVFWAGVSSSSKFQALATLGERSSFESRLMVWRAAWEIGKDHPLFGIGLGTFQEYYLAYQERFATPYLEWAVPQPHNLFLAFWLQTGVLGLFGFLWLLAGAFRRIFLKIKTGLSEEGLRALVLGSVLIYLILHGLVDTPFWKNDLALGTFLVLFLAIHYGASQQRR